MKHKNGIRSRPIDDKKQLKVIKDLTKAKLDADNESLVEINNIEKELYKVLEYYEKRKKIEIPKGKIINEKNDKNESLNTYCINNNIIYSNEISSNSQNLKHLNNTYILNYKLNEYKRPNNYIIYSSSQRNKNELNIKEYEAKDDDFIFLKIRNNFMSISELEDIIIDLENNATNSKDEKIDEEKAKNIIETKYSKYKNYAECIINHFKHRRNSSKKSLIRKKWLINKSTDKYLTTTFKKRGTDKIKTRKNTQNKQESLNKIIDAQLLCKNTLLTMINNLNIKENLDKNLLKINEYIFLSECDKVKNAEISGNRIKENNSLKESIEAITKNLRDIDKANEINMPNEKPFKDHKNINKVNNNGNNAVNSNNRNLNDEELNRLEYELAIIIDKRTYFQFYFSLVKRKQLILFAFIPNNDYNLVAIKIALLLLSFSLYFTVNGFFFSDSTMNKINEDKGEFNILFQIPQILYSSVISTVINVILKQLSLSERQILSIKQENNFNVAQKKSKKLRKYIKIKLALFFFLSILLLIFFWYFISCFCAVYKNTQMILIKDTLISFGLSMLYPFGLNLIPGMFRIPALRAIKKDKKNLYKFSNLLNLFL